MAQFDSLIVLPLIFSMLIVLIFHYNISIQTIIPDFFGIKKFRIKKLDSSYFPSSKHNRIGINLANSYKLFYIKSKIIFRTIII